MAEPEPQTPESVRRQIEFERESSLIAVDSLRGRGEDRA